LDSKSQNKSSTHVNGLKTNSVLNQLKYFNVVTGLPPDLMHDLLEGCVRFTFTCLMKHLTTNKIYSADDLNEDLTKFRYGRVDMPNKVPSDLFSSNSTFKISATHQWMLMRIFPIMAGERLFSNELSREHYLNYIRISEITRALYDDSFTIEKINQLKVSIDTYLKDFKSLYRTFDPKSNIWIEHKLIPKQHFLLHYPTAILNWGPPSRYNTIRFESKHSYFKRVIAANHNSINLCYSLAKRHQFLQTYHLLSDEYFINLELGPSHSVEKYLLAFIKLDAQIQSANITLHKWVIIKGIKYKINDLIVTSKSNDLPIFSKILSIIKKKNFIFFLINEFDTICYNYSQACYMIEAFERAPLDKICKFDNLIHLWPLNAYSVNNEYFLVSPKYPI